MNIPTNLPAIQLDTIIKFGLLILLGMFIIYIIIILRQIHEMNQIIQQTFYGTFLNILAFTLLLASLALFLYGIFVL